MLHRAAQRGGVQSHSQVVSPFTAKLRVAALRAVCDFINGRLMIITFNPAVFKCHRREFVRSAVVQRAVTKQTNPTPSQKLLITSHFYAFKS